MPALGTICCKSLSAVALGRLPGRLACPSATLGSGLHTNFKHLIPFPWTAGTAFTELKSIRCRVLQSWHNSRLQSRNKVNHLEQGNSPARSEGQLPVCYLHSSRLAEFLTLHNTSSQHGQGRAGQGRAGQGRAGQAGHGRAGQGRAGQGSKGQGQAYMQGPFCIRVADQRLI